MDPAGLLSLDGCLKQLIADGDTLAFLEATLDLENFRLWLDEGLGYGDATGAVDQISM